jgi:hypothetical protein
VTLLEYLSIRRGSGGPQRPSSWLSERIRGVLTIITEAGEMTCVPTFSSSVPPPCPSGRWYDPYFLGTSPRNVYRNGWETVVL